MSSLNIKGTIIKLFDNILIYNIISFVQKMYDESESDTDSKSDSDDDESELVLLLDDHRRKFQPDTINDMKNARGKNVSLLWRFNNAPGDLQYIANQGGDEESLCFHPSTVGYPPEVGGQYRSSKTFILTTLDRSEFGQLVVHWH